MCPEHAPHHNPAPAIGNRNARRAAKYKHVEKLNYSVDEAAYAAGLSRSLLYEAIAAGELESLKAGSRRLIPVDALERWNASKSAAA